MPIYEYECNGCSLVVEELQQMGAKPPICCGREMRRKPASNLMIKIKGSGGYPSRRKMIRNTPHPRTY